MSTTTLTRGQFLQLGALGGLAATALASCATTRSHAKQRPNFVIVFADDQTYRAIGYTNSIVKTPHLDALANDGVIFNHAYVASPICVASRASIMSGLFPEQHGSVALDAAGFQKSVVTDKQYPTFAQLLAQSGYTTAYCGKSHLGEPNTFGFSEGKEHSDVFDNESFAFAEQFLASRRDNADPFLLWVGARQPHVPLLPEQEWLDLYNDAPLGVDPNFRESPPDGSIYNQGKPGERYYRDTAFTKNYRNLSSGPPRTKEQIIEFKRAYYATISRLDSQVGTLVEQLKASGHYENTVFIYLADNGYHLGNHGLGNKITMHEESVRIPMFVHWRAMRERGVRSDALVSSLDLFPTLLDLAGVEAPGHLMGESLAPVLRNAKRKVRDYVVSECVGVGGKVGEGHRMVRTARWKYVLTDSNEEALFDEVGDPFELKNVIGEPDNAGVAMEHRAMLREWMERVGDRHALPPA